jgi:uncharacterized membrane protein YecN with MAPEG domain
MMTITPAYAAVLGLIFVALSVRTIRMRRRHRVAVGDGGNAELRRAMRVHANFAEYVPLALLLIFFVEHDGAETLLVHALGIALLAGRLLHAWGVSQEPENFRYRVSGMALTFGTVITAALAIFIARLG